MTAVLPWQDAPWQRLLASRAAGRLPHALLVSGPPGVGKDHFVTALAGALMCEADGAEACGACPGCRQLQAGAHPDYSLWEPEEDATTIRIDQVRELTGTIHLTRSRAPWKVGVIRPADAMTYQAADSLLKTLEEPPPQTLLVLVTARPGQLSATIRSRCQQVRLAPCYGEPATGWLVGRGVSAAAAAGLLAVAGGAPLRALALAEEGALEEGRRVAAEVGDLLRGRADPVAVAARWVTAGLARVLPWAQVTVQDGIRLAFDPTGASLRHGTPENRAADLSLAANLPLSFEVDARLTRLAEALAWRHNVSPNSLAEQVTAPLYRGGVEPRA